MMQRNTILHLLYNVNSELKILFKNGNNFKSPEPATKYQSATNHVSQSGQKKITTKRRTEFAEVTQRTQRLLEEHVKEHVKIVPHEQNTARK